MGIAIRPSLYRVNTSHLLDLPLQDKLVTLWEEIRSSVEQDGSNVDRKFFNGLYESKKITRSYEKERAKQRREKEGDLKAKLALAQVALEWGPQCPSLQASLAIAEIEMKEFLSTKTRWIMEIARQKWLLTNTQCLPALAATFRQQAIQKEITSLKDEDGIVQTAWKEISETTRRHFVRLFGIDTPPCEAAMEEVLVGQSQRKTVMH